MTSLYNRTTSVQERILRIVEGSVRNAAASHPEARFGERFPRSVAKRAAGTITAQFAVALAGSDPSDRGSTAPLHRAASGSDASVLKASTSAAGSFRGAGCLSDDVGTSAGRIGRVSARKARPVSSKKRAMRKVRKEIAILVTAAKDDLVRVAALNDALAIISGSTAADRIARNA